MKNGEQMKKINTWIIWKGEYRHFEFGNEILNDEEMLENVCEQFYK